MNLEWQDCEKIAEHELVHESLIAFAEDPTRDNALCLIRDIAQMILVDNHN